MMNETTGRPIIVLVGHGGLPQGMLDAAEMILGKQGGVHVITLAPGEDPEDLGRRLTALTAEALAQDGAHDLLVLGDLFGGSPANAAAATSSLASASPPICSMPGMRSAALISGSWLGSARSFWASRNAAT